MSKKNITEPLSGWQVENIRLTAFPESPVESKEINWWQDIVGELPDSSTFHPKTGELREMGPFDSFNLSVIVNSDRIDWQFLQNQSSVNEIPTIGDFDEILIQFKKLMSEWLKSYSPKLKRVAFGTVLLLPVNDRKQGYEKLSNYLKKVEIDTENSSDFSYQINRVRNSESGVKNLRINRLSKWSVAVFVNTIFNLHSGIRTSEQILMPGTHACRLEIDINTIAEYPDSLPKNKLGVVFNELVNFGREIVEKGDIK